jgi:pyruvate/2-oxoglutarate dehydrogenase complex dihydrolipoamide acyltransferase (E2) component
MKEGDKFADDQPICEITLDVPDAGEIMLGLDANHDGILAKIIANPGETLATDSVLAIYFYEKSHYIDYLERQRITSRDHNILENVAPTEPETATAAASTADGAAAAPSSGTLLLKTVRTLIKNGEVDADSDFGKELQTLARKGNADLLSVFEASYDGTFSEADFDKKFFLQNATEVVKDSLKEKKAA